MEAVECGAASLAMILAWAGRYEKLDDVRHACGVSRDGSNAGSLLKAARNYGFDAHGYRRSADTVDTWKFPAIIFWNFNHFVVIEGASQKIVYLNDPGCGRREISRADFTKGFSGIVLEFTVTDQFVPGGTPPSTSRDIGALLSGLGVAPYMLLACATVLALASVITPSLSSIFFDNVVVRGEKAWLNPLVLVTLTSIVIVAVLTTITQIVLRNVENRLAVSGATKLMWRALRLPVSFFAERQVVDVINRVDANSRIAAAVGGPLGSGIVEVSSAFFAFLAMLLYRPSLAVLAMVLAVGNALILQFLKNVRKAKSVQYQMEHSKLYAASITGLQFIETLKAGGGEHDFFARWAGYQARSLNTEQTLGLYDEVGVAAPTIISALATVILLLAGGYGNISGELSVGDLLAFQMLLGIFTISVSRMSDAVKSGQELAGDLTRVNDVMTHPLEWRFAPRHEGALGARAQGKIELRGVTFGYNTLAPPLINKLDLVIEAGCSVALVGGSGSGKSTIANLIVGLVSPWQGQILLDDVPLLQWGAEALASSVAKVDQDINLFSGSVLDNVSLWDPTLPREKVQRALEDAAMYDIVQKMPGNLLARIDEGGRNLSGGQAQRLEIARALAHEPPVLILDEATSALDTLTENHVVQSIRRRGLTSIVVAHRLSAVRDCNLIIVLDKGQPVERGTHDELMAVNGIYANLMRSE